MEIVEYILHFNEHLASVIKLFGPYTYVLIFAIIFAETGVVVMPFLPGDSLLFVIGTLAGSGYLNIWIVYITLITAAILGDTVNYWIGHHFGRRVFSRENSRIFNKAYLEKTQEFYAKHGGKTIILARFIPIIRTFAPFVAGLGRMHYHTFFLYNVVGAFIWVTSITFAGYFLGALPWVKDNFEYAVIVILGLSLVPVVFEFIKHRLEKKSHNKEKETSYQEIQKTMKKEHLND